MQSCQERATSSGAPGARNFFQERERATFQRERERNLRYFSATLAFAVLIEFACIFRLIVR